MGVIEFVLWVVSVIAAFFFGRWVQRRRSAGATPEEIVSDLKAKAKEAAEKVKK